MQNTIPFSLFLSRGLSFPSVQSTLQSVQSFSPIGQFNRSDETSHLNQIDKSKRAIDQSDNSIREFNFNQSINPSIERTKERTNNSPYPSKSHYIATFRSRVPCLYTGHPSLSIPHVPSMHGIIEVKLVSLTVRAVIHIISHVSLFLPFHSIAFNFLHRCMHQDSRPEISNNPP